jgi:hypothetical protein
MRSIRQPITHVHCTYLEMRRRKQKHFFYFLTLLYKLILNICICYWTSITNTCNKVMFKYVLQKYVFLHAYSVCMCLKYGHTKHVTQL